MVLASGEISDGGEETGALGIGGVGVTFGDGVIMLSEGCLRDQSSNSGVVGVMVNDEQLLVEDIQLLAGAGQSTLGVV